MVVIIINGLQGREAMGQMLRYHRNYIAIANQKIQCVGLSNLLCRKKTVDARYFIDDTLKWKMYNKKTRQQYMKLKRVPIFQRIGGFYSKSSVTRCFIFISS